MHGICPNCGFCPACGRADKPNDGPGPKPWPGYPQPYIGDPLPWQQPYVGDPIGGGWYPTTTYGIQVQCGPGWTDAGY